MKRDIIKELQSDPNIWVECPETEESFPLKKAFLFYADGPIPDKVQKYLDETRQDIKDRKKALMQLRKKTRERVEKATTSIKNPGQSANINFFKLPLTSHPGTVPFNRTFRIFDLTFFQEAGQ